MQLPGVEDTFKIFVSFLDWETMPNGDYRDYWEGLCQDHATRQDRVDQVEAAAAAVRKEATGETIDR